MCFQSKTTFLAIVVLSSIAAVDTVGQEILALSEPRYEEPAYEEPTYEEPYTQEQPFDEVAGEMPAYETAAYETAAYEEDCGQLDYGRLDHGESSLQGLGYQEAAFLEPAYEPPPLEHSVLQGPIQNAPIPTTPQQPPLTVYGEQPLSQDDSYGIALNEPAPSGLQPYPYASPSCDSGFLDIGCGVEELGCAAVPSPACGCGPVCGCETSYESPLGGVFETGICGPSGCDVGGSLRRVIGDTSQCDPCAANEIRPGLLTWTNDWFVENGFAIDSFLQSGRGYFSIDFGIGMTNDRAEATGGLATSLGGFPDYDLREGSFGRYALGLGGGKNRMELELGFHRNTIDETKSGSGPRSQDRFQTDGYRRSTTFMLNGYRDFHNATFWTPYLKAGAGISHNMARATTVADINSAAAIAALGLPGASRQRTEFPRSSTTKFAWSVGAGIATDLTERIKFDVEYQFLNAGDARTGVDAIGNAIKLGNGALHELAFGLRFYR
jgi:opacity protein-like surface antigen